MNDVALVRYDAACKALAEAKAVDEVQKIRNVAEAMRAYARQAKNKQLEVDAQGIRFRAERRIGEMMREQAAAVGLNSGAKGVGTKVRVDDKPTLSEAGIDKNLADRARKLAAIPKKQFEGLLDDWQERVQKEGERVTTNLLRAGERAQKKDDRPARPLPAGSYRLIYADPPWRYDHVETESRAIENQYPTMALDEICALKVPAAKDCVLFLWATSPKLAEAMQVIDAWGFNYRTCAVWDKEVIGMGYYFRQQHELLLVATRGEISPPKPSNRPSSVIRSRRSRHSKKPDEAYKLLESMYPLKSHERVELFNRTPREGWTIWGNEPIEKGA